MRKPPWWSSDLGRNIGTTEMGWGIGRHTHPQKFESMQLTLSALTFPAEPPKNEAWCKLARSVRGLRACIDGPADSEDRSQQLIGGVSMTQLLSHRPRDLHVTFFASVIILRSHWTCGCLFFACRQVPCFIYSPFSVSLPNIFLLSSPFVDFSEIPPLYANNTFLPDLRRAARSRLHEGSKANHHPPFSLVDRVLHSSLNLTFKNTT